MSHLWTFGSRLPSFKSRCQNHGLTAVDLARIQLESSGETWPSGRILQKTRKKTWKNMSGITTSVVICVTYQICSCPTGFPWVSFIQKGFPSSRTAATELMTCWNAWTRTQFWVIGFKPYAIVANFITSTLKQYCFQVGATWKTLSQWHRKPDLVLVAWENPHMMPVLHHQ